MSTPRVAAVILNYNGQELLERYLPSIIELEYGNYDIFVVDNNSSDNSVAFLKENYPQIQVVELKENVGISGGYDAGVEAAPDADYYWFLNNDVRVTPSSLNKLVDRAESNQRTGIVFPRFNNMDSETIQSLGFQKDIFGYGAYPDIGKGQTEPPFTCPREIVHGMGAAMLVDREVYTEVGGLDTENFLYGGDTYLCQQAWVRGHHVEVVPESVVYHEEDATISDNPLKPFHFMRSKTRSYLKTFQLSTIVIGFPGFILLLFGQILKDVLTRRRLKTPVYRLLGFFSAIRSLPEIIAHRRQLKQERVYDDSEFLTSIGETLGGSNMEQQDGSSSSQ